MPVREAGLLIPSDESLRNNDRFFLRFFLVRYAFPVNFLVFGTGHFFPCDLDVIRKVEHISASGLAQLVSQRRD